MNTIIKNAAIGLIGLGTLACSLNRDNKANDKSLDTRLDSMAAEMGMTKEEMISKANFAAMDLGLADSTSIPYDAYPQNPGNEGTIIVTQKDNLYSANLKMHERYVTGYISDGKVKIIDDGYAVIKSNIDTKLLKKEKSNIPLDVVYTLIVTSSDSQFDNLKEQGYETQMQSITKIRSETKGKDSVFYFEGITRLIPEKFKQVGLEKDAVTLKNYFTAMKSE